jgi:FlaA1/EpsC-like NDP-sugar epimerase
MINKHISRKGLLLFAGDLIVIAATYALAAAIRFGNISHGIPLKAGSFAALLGIYAFIFYLFDLYDFELKFKHARYVFKHITAVTVAAAMMSIGFFSFRPCSTAGQCF